ncbi:MAG: stringent starvation protein SspA [Coxiellaceae bacterium]|nr:stringent starvation protein SspA [Coxiellaceae bacterium]
MLRRSVMTLYSGTQDIDSHQVRIVLAEKGVSVDVLNIDANHPSEDLAELNPYNTLPTLVDRELVLYQSRVIMEYLDERFPHPPLLPVYPVARAKSRLMMCRIEKDWYSLYRIIENDPHSEAAAIARRDLRESLSSLAPVFAEMEFFLSEEFSLVDCVVAPLLWRLPSLGIELPPKQAKLIETYAERIFDRDSFQVSLTEVEREIREHDDI